MTGMDAVEKQVEAFVIDSLVARWGALIERMGGGVEKRAVGTQ